MESARINTIINLYAELKAKGKQFEDAEPCFVEANDYIAKLWTTTNQSGGSGNENPYPIEIPAVEGTNEGVDEVEGKGQGKSTGSSIKVKGKTEGGGQGEGGEGQGEGQGEQGEGEGKEQGEGERHGGDKEGEEKTDDKGKGQQPIPPIEEPEFTEEEEENIADYKMGFPLITDMIYGIKVCNATTEQETELIERKILVGVGITICRSLMAEGSRYGESVISTKKESYRKIFDMIRLLFLSKNKYDCDGNLLDVNIEENKEDLKNLILADKFVSKIIPILSVFNKDLFNEKQLSNAVDFCMARLNEKNSMLVSSNYADATVETVWGLILINGDDRKNYTANYYRYSSVNVKNPITERNERHRSLEKVKIITIDNGNIDFSLDLQSMGDGFYHFTWNLILNYLNSSPQDIDKQTFSYKNKKDLIMESVRNILMESVNTFELLV